MPITAYTVVMHFVLNLFLVRILTLNDPDYNRRLYRHHYNNDDHTVVTQRSIPRGGGGSGLRRGSGQPGAPVYRNAGGKISSPRRATGGEGEDGD